MSGNQALMLLSAGEAQRLTQRIKLTASSVRDGLFKLRNLVEEAKRSNVWQVLGYPSWTAYLADTLADEPMRLGRDERQQLVGYLSGEGLSTRAIAPIVGVHHDTVASDIKKAPVGNPTPGLPSVPVPFMDEQVAEITATEQPDDLDVSVNFETGEVIEKPRKITGLDGKTYTPPTAPRRAPFEDAFFRAIERVNTAIASLETVAGDDRLPRNKEKVARYRNDLLNNIDALQRIADAITETESTK